LKECVIAHQSSAPAPIMVGTEKSAAEARDSVLGQSGRGAFQ
jgi:hypothetical protein